MKLVLDISGIGHVPSMKNSKMLTRGRLITNPKKQKWMDLAASSIASQLTSAYLTCGGETGTGLSLRSWIASCLPLDDNLDWIGVPSGSWQQVKPGEEGATITIEPIDV